MKTRKRILAGILTAILTISMLPSAAFATETTGNEPEPETAVVSTEEQETESVTEEVTDTEEAIEETSEEAAQETSEEAAAEETTVQQEEETAEPQEEETAEPTAEETAEPAAEETVPVTTLKAYGSDYFVTVTFDASAEIPADARVKVEEVAENSKKYDYDDYLEQAAEVIDSDVDSISYVRLFDIKIVDADGNKIDPAASVDVQIRLKDVKEADDTMQVVHFGKESTDVIEPEVTGNTVAFATEGFSIYAFIGTGDYEILTVNFYGADQTTPIETAYVKNADKTNGQLESVIYDPGAGTIPSGSSFYGWSIGEADYSVTGTGKTINEVREYIRGLDFSTVENKTLNIYAMMVSYYKVSFLGEGGINLGSDTVMVKTAGDEASYTVNRGYSTDSEHHFEGWLVNEGLNNITVPADAEEDTLFINGTTITIKGNVTFSVSAPPGHWLVFNENGKHATYNAPRFIESGEVTSSEGLLEMTRNGYTFGGWFTGAPEAEGGDPTGEPFEFGHEIDSATTIYAKWIPASSANYTVIIWLEGVAQGTWDFEETLTIAGTPGQTINTVQPQGNGNNRYARINSVDKKYTGFRYDHHDTGVTIAPEGDSVVNVYYIRNTYTLSFQSAVGIGDLRFTFREITARYGVDISSYFPITTAQGFGIFTNLIASWFNSLVRWEPQNGTTFNKPVVYIDTMPAESITFYTDRSLASEKEMYYYAEALPGQTPVRTFNGKSFVLLAGPLGARYNYFTEAEDFLEINGYVKYGSEPTFNSQGQATGNTLRCYYTRELETISFMNGSYFDGNNRRMSTGNGQLNTATGIPYGSDISSYNKGQANYYTPENEEGFVFEGWYIDKTCTTPYTFNRMPAGTIIVYAKWRQIQYRVFLHPNAGTDPTLDWGSENQSMCFRVSYGDKISPPEGLRTGYKFYGWHTDPELTTLAYADGLVMNETTVTDDGYDKTVDMTDEMDQWGNGATTNADVDRFWITKKYDLYAKWGKVITGADGIGIIYDVGTDGSNPPRDMVKYQDNTTAVAGAAPTANQDKVFEKWVVQRWNGTAFENTNVEVLPGQTFNVHVEDAEIVDNATNAHVALDDVVGGKEYTYTIQVKAVYSDKEEVVPTHITWYKNDGSGAYYRHDEPIKINEPKSVYGLGEGEKDNLKRDGYTFIGWAKDTERLNAQDAPNTSTDETTANFLEYKDGKFYLPGTETEVTQVAADEITPYEALYAVWEKNQYHIYHSATGLTTDHDIPATGRDNITAKVTDKYIYGGYYEYDDTVDGKRGTVITKDPGTDMVPEKGHTYYLKEVDGNYLKPNVYLVSSKIHNGMIRSLYGFVDYDVRDDYTTGGLVITGKESDGEAIEGGEIEIFDPEDLTNGNIAVTQGDKELDPLTAKRLFGIDSAVYGYADLTGYIDFGRKLYIQGYYETKDGVRVTGIKTRVIQFAEEDPQYDYDVPVFTGWNNDGNTVCGLATVGSTCTPVSASSSSEGQSAGGTYSISPKLTLRIAADVLTYTITKVCNPGVELQTVEEGCRTGEITVPEREGYYFGGWYTDGAFTSPADFSDVRSDMTVYARYIKAEDVSVSFTLKSSKSGTVTFNATASVKGDIDLAGVTLTANGSESVLGSRSVKKTGSGKNVKYTTRYKGTAAVKGTSLSGSFAASLAWTTADGTAVSGPAYNCKYVIGKVTVK